MSVSWNPNSTSTKGLEAFLPTSKTFALDSATKCLGMSLDQSTSQAIGTIKVPVLSIPTRGGRYILEVFDGEDGVSSADAGAVTTLTARPNEDVSIGLWKGTSGDTTNIYDHIDETVADGSDWIYVLISNGVNTYYGRMSTGSLSLTGKRITAVRLCAYARPYSSRSASIGQFGLNIGGTDYFGSYWSMPSNEYVLVSTEWTANPSTGAPWSIADVQTFDTTNEWSVTNPTSGPVQIKQAWMEVDTADAADARLAVGVLDDSASGLTAGAWNSVTVTTPTGGTWTKDASGRHLYTLRRTSSSGSLVIPLLDGAELAFASGWRPTLDVSGYITAMGDARTEVFGLIQRTTAPADSADSQPYVTQVEALVYSGQDAEQEFSNAGVASYGWVRALVKANSATLDLSVKVKKRSDNTQLGATLTFTPAEVAALPDAGGGWREITGTLSSTATLTTGTQYYLEFSSSAPGTTGDYWSVCTLDTWGSGDAYGFGGTTDRALVTLTTSDAAAEADRYDLVATLSVAPSALSGGDTAVQTLTLTDGLGLAVAEIDYVRCSWTASALGASFARYEVARSEDGGTTWATIAKITEEAVEYFDDIEGRRSVAASYRARVIDTAGAAAAWVTLGSETPAGQTSVMYFTTNWSLEDSVAFMVVPAPAWQPLDSVALQQPYGVDGNMAFRGTERRLRSFTAALYPVEQLSSTGRAGVGVFDALEDLVVQQIPYLCVMDCRGDRWLGDVLVGAETEAAPGDYTQQITVTELSRTPVPVTLTAVPA